MKPRDGVRGGAYARRQLFGANPILRWSHGRRFALARALVAARNPATLLDYGCGDGTFLAQSAREGLSAVGLEADERLVADCAARLAKPGLRFAHVDEADHLEAGGFDMIFCMEVLEHCTADAAAVVLARLDRLLGPQGTLVVSVPIEVGPPLLAKQAVRAVAAWTGAEGYRDRERYSARELWATVRGARDAVVRPVYEVEAAPGRVHRYHGHKGFDWRALRDRLAATYGVATRFSPLGAAGPLLNSQAWFVCTHR
jgi:SAM-dependent methyltransferase